MTGWLTLQAWNDKTTITDVKDVRVDGRDLLVDGPTGTLRISGSEYGAWTFVREVDGEHEYASGVGYAHCDEA